MPYCCKLLQADILPQKLSRRWVMVIFDGVSGVACTRTGTPRRARRSVALCFFVVLDGAVLALLCTEHNDIPARLLQNLSHLLAPGLRQMIWKEPPVPHNQPHRHFSFGRHIPLRRFLSQTSSLVGAFTSTIQGIQMLSLFMDKDLRAT